MSDATGTVTTNFSFKTLDDGDRAGYAGINEVVTSVDTQVEAYFTGTIVLYTGTTAPTGWTSVNTALIAAGASTVTGYIWIKKN